MTTSNGSLIHVSEQAWGEVRPQAAFVHVTLTADKLFSGRAAFEKAEELSKLAKALFTRGLPDDALSLEGASIDVSTGLFSRASSVTYRVRIHVTQIDDLPSVLDAVAQAKQATLTNISWDYKGPSQGATELLRDCAARAYAKAKVLATALGVSIAAIHSVQEEALDESVPYPVCAAPKGVVRAKRGSIADQFGGIDLVPTRKQGVRVQIACRLASSSPDRA